MRLQKDTPVDFKDAVIIYSCPPLFFAAGYALGNIIATLKAVAKIEDVLEPRPLTRERPRRMPKRGGETGIET